MFDFIAPSQAMGDKYRYPVYLECGTLSSKQELAVRRYFLIRRKSGGGECGPLTRVNRDLYKVLFREREDQLSVLQRSQHEVWGRLVFTVRGTLEPHQPGDVTTPASPAEQQAIPASPPPSSGGEGELRPDGSTMESLAPLHPDEASLSLPPNADGGGVWEVESSPDEASLQDRSSTDEAMMSDEVQEDSLSFSENLASVSFCRGSSPSRMEVQHPPSTCGGSILVEIVKGTIESQQVEAVVCPMVGYNPLSSRVGSSLHQKVGSQLTARFRNESGPEVLVGVPVLLEDLPGLPSNAVFFLSLSRWNGDPSGTAVEVLRMGIKSILDSCDRRGFRSVAFPVLGAGLALSFPVNVVAKVLQEEIYAFEEYRSSSAPLLVRIVIHPDDKESSEAFKEVQPDLHQREPHRIVLLGKTGCGKSSLASILFGETLFAANHSPNSGTSKCQSETRCVEGRSFTLIDTPGFFDTERSEEELKPEIVSCITECAPGPHAFLILLKVEKFSTQEQAVIDRICEYFSEDALKHAVVVFTHGDQLPEGQKIEDFVGQNAKLSELVRRCGGRCHVFDSTHWNDAQQDDYRSNRYQRRELLGTIERLVAARRGACYTNAMLQEVEQLIQQQEQDLRVALPHLPAPLIRQRARSDASRRLLIRLAGIVTGSLLGAFFGVQMLVGFALATVKNPAQLINQARNIPTLLGATAAGATAGEVVLAVGLAVGVTAAVTGAVLGGIAGNEAAQEAETPLEAVKMAAKSVWEKKKKF